MREQYKIWRGNAGLTTSDLDRVSELAHKANTKQAAVGENRDQNTKIRSSRIGWINDGWLRERLYSYAEEANRRAFAFDFTRCCEMQYTEYHAEEKGHYDWHVDVSYTNDVPYDRKLSLTVQLSDPSEYEGGNFVLERQKMPDWYKEKGTILVFPSYLRHRVEPVTKGVRRSLVAWFEGPRWR